MKKNLINILSFVFLFLFLLVSILVLVVDVEMNFRTGTKVGLYTINQSFAKNYVKDSFDLISDIILSLSLGSAFVIFGLGLLQFIKNKSFKKVDKDIIVYGFVWLLLIGLWFLFDHVLIFNYRPVLIKGGLEPSFPSTHVLVSTFSLYSACYFIKKESDKKYASVISYSICTIITIALCIFRVASNMHWLTDVLAGFLLGQTLHFLFMYYVTKKNTKKIGA